MHVVLCDITLSSELQEYNVLHCLPRCLNLLQRKTLITLLLPSH